MPSLELTLAISEAELMDWLEQEVNKKLVEVKRQGFDSYQVMLVMEDPDDDQPVQRAIRMHGECDKHRTGFSFQFLDSTWDLDGQVVIQLVPLGERSTRVLIDYDGDPLLRARVEQVRMELEALEDAQAVNVLEELPSQETGTTAQEDTPIIPRRKGGPVPLSDDEKLRLVKGWLAQQGRQTQDAYARTNDISASTLRRYRRDLEASGKL